MTTLVGTQKDFLDAITALLELEYDVVEAYETAINRIESEDYKKHLEEFKQDHQKHIQGLNTVLKAHGEGAIYTPSAKQWLLKGKVVLGGLIGDKSILEAMYVNEKDSNAAYEKMNIHPDKWEDAKDIIEQGLDDEKRHKQWFEEHKGKN
jgi:rubrerythrin